MSARHWRLDPDTLEMSVEATGLVDEVVRRLSNAQLDYEESVYRKALIDMGWTPPGALADTLRSFASGYAQESARHTEMASKYGGYEAGIRDTFMAVANGLREEADCIESKKETPNG